MSSLTNLKFENNVQSDNANKRDLYNLDIIDLIRRKFWIICFFTLLLSAASVLFYFKAPKTYESTAKIFVDEKSAPSVNSNDRESFATETSVEKHLQTLKSTLVLEPAISSGRFYDMEMFNECDDILYLLREKKTFIAKPADVTSNSGVIKLALQGNSPEECQRALQSIVNSFDRYIRSTTKNIGGENADIVQKAQTDWLNRLQEVEKSIEELSARPELLTVDGRVTDPYQLQLSLMHKDLHDLRSERNKVSARIESVRRDQALGRSSKDLVNEIMAEMNGVSDQVYARVQDQMVELRVEEQELLNQFGPDHPQVRSVRKQIEIVDEMRSQELASMRNGPSGSGVTPDVVASFFKTTERRVELLTSEEQQIEEQIAEVRKKSTSVSALVERLNALTRERDRLEAGYSAIIERMSEIKALKEHLWRNLSVLDPPSVAEAVAPNLPVCLAGGLFLGGLTGIGFAVLKDAAEKTFRSSDDVGEMMNTQVVGHISLFRKRAIQKSKAKFPNVRPEVMAIHQPSSQVSESFRAIRTTVFFKDQESSAKVIQITSPTPGDGKSTTCANLAASIAQSGRRVLLIDADMRRPTQHTLFGLANTTGLSSIITGEATLNEAVQSVIPDYLSFLGSGPIPSNPAELLTSGRFGEVIRQSRDEYDYVLIDTPPVLAVTDPSIVCGHAELLFMVMRIRNGVRTNALRSKEVIDAMGANLGGVIINGLRRKDQKSYQYSGQYGYGSYSYGNTDAVVEKEKISSMSRSRPKSVGA